MARASPRGLWYAGLALSDDRRLPLEGVWNFRDIGGYGAADGREVRRGVVFRSSRLSEITDGDRDRLAALGISTICDLRRQDERTRAPSRLDFADDPQVVHLPPTTPATAGFRRLLAAGEKRVGPYRELIVQSYRELARDNHTVWSAVVRAILEAPGATVLHCNAGQDRTGIAVAVVLLALGVAREEVVADYCLTAGYGPPPDAERMYERMRAAGLDPPEPAALIEILAPTADLIGTFLETVEQDHSSLETYLTRALGVSDGELTALRARLLG